MYVTSCTAAQRVSRFWGQNGRPPRRNGLRDERLATAAEQKMMCCAGKPLLLQALSSLTIINGRGEVVQQKAPPARMTACLQSLVLTCCDPCAAAGSAYGFANCSATETAAAGTEREAVCRYNNCNVSSIILNIVAQKPLQRTAHA